MTEIWLETFLWVKETIQIKDDLDEILLWARRLPQLQIRDYKKYVALFFVYKEILLYFIKPTIEELEESNLFTTFHFLFEPGHLLFRVRAKDEQSRKEIKFIIKRNLDLIRELLITKSDEEIFNEDYHGEQEGFSKDGWELTQKHFEYGSRIALLRLEKIIKGETLKKFNESKLIHCFLNQLGYSFDELEADYHIDSFFGRILLKHNKNSIDEELKREMREKIENRLEEWKNRVVVTR